MKILWIAKDPITDEQLSDLKRIYHHAYEFEIIKPDFSTFDVPKIIKHFESCDVLAIKVPDPVLATLLKSIDTTKDIIVPEFNRIFSGRKVRDELTYTMKEECIIKHICWKKVKLAISEQEL